MNVRCFILFIAVYSFTLVAGAQSISLDKIHTTDELYVSQGRGSYRWHDKGWKASYLYQDVEFRREAPDNSATVQRGDVGYRWAIATDDTIDLVIGAFAVDSRVATTSTLVGRAVYQKKSDKQQVTVSLEKRSLPEVFRSTSLAGISLTEERLDALYSRIFDKHWKLQGALAGTKISDDNHGVSYDAAVMYGISPGWPWIWLGYGASGLYFEDAKVGYWSPEKFYTHGPRFDSSFPLYGEFSGIVGANLNFYKENETQGDGFLLSAGLQWGRYDGNNVRVLYTKIRSGQSQSPWVYEGIRASCTVISF